MTTQTPITGGIVKCIKLAMRDTDHEYRIALSEGAFNAIEDLERALTAERAKNAKLREEVLEEAAKAVEGEICGCCWSEDAQAFAEHAAETLRAMKEKK